MNGDSPSQWSGTWESVIRILYHSAEPGQSSAEINDDGGSWSLRFLAPLEKPNH